MRYCQGKGLSAFPWEHSDTPSNTGTYNLVHDIDCGNIEFLEGIYQDLVLSAEPAVEMTLELSPPVVDFTGIAI